MGEEKHIPNMEQPLNGVTWFKPEQCRDCVFRYKDYFIIDGRKIPCDENIGWRKDCCQIYPYPQGKPPEVSKHTGVCEYYEQEKQKRK